MEPMSVDRWGHALTLLLDGRVLATGGRSETSVYLGTAEIYDPATGRWTPTDTMSSAWAWHSVVLLDDGRVVITGGSPVAGRMEISDPEIRVWSDGPGIPNGR